ncbi:hypothetical protein T484DRAFT_1907547, partial [Baffinella frigidus]
EEEVGWGGEGGVARGGGVGRGGRVVQPWRQPSRTVGGARVRPPDPRTPPPPPRLSPPHPLSRARRPHHPVRVRLSRRAWPLVVVDGGGDRASAGRRGSRRHRGRKRERGEPLCGGGWCKGVGTVDCDAIPGDCCLSEFRG